MDLELQRSFHLSGGSGMGAGFDAYLWVILGIMIAAGLLGGIANYFLVTYRGRGEAERERGAAPSRLRYPVLGIVVALTAPLFLRMLSSDLVDAARVRATDFFVFAGFCICYVVATRGIVDAIAARVMEQWKLLRRDIDDFEKMSHSSRESAGMAENKAEEVMMPARNVKAGKAGKTAAASRNTETRAVEADVSEVKKPAGAAREEPQPVYSAAHDPVAMGRNGAPVESKWDGMPRIETAISTAGTAGVADERQDIRQDVRQDGPRTEHVRTDPDISNVPNTAGTRSFSVVETRIEPSLETSAPSLYSVPPAVIPPAISPSTPAIPSDTAAVPEAHSVPPSAASEVSDEMAPPPDFAALSSVPESSFPESPPVSVEESPPEKRLSPQAQSAIELLSYNDVEIMYVIAAEAAVYGNLSALTEKTGLNRDLLSTRLTMLKNLGLIETRIDEENILHWFVTDKGKEILNELFAGQRRSKGRMHA